MRLKNRNLKKLEEGSRQADNSEYYANLVTNKFESEFDRRYKVNPENLIPMERAKKQEQEKENPITPPEEEKD